MANVLKISRCNCKDEFQDLTYGTGMRVMNPLGKNQVTTAVQMTHICTVCGTRHKLSGNTDAGKKTKKDKENGKKGKKTTNS